MFERKFIHCSHLSVNPSVLLIRHPLPVTLIFYCFHVQLLLNNLGRNKLAFELKTIERTDLYTM